MQISLYLSNTEHNTEIIHVLIILQFIYNSEQKPSLSDNDDDEEADLVLSLETSHLSNQFTKGIIIIIIISIVHHHDDV